MTTFSEKFTSGTNFSCWLDSIIPISFSALNRDIKTDVVIVGGGIAGLSIAYQLTRLNQEVIVIDDGFIGGGETGRTSAHLVTALDERYYSLIKIFGEKDAQLAAESHATAIDFIEEAVKREHIDCDFKRVSGYLFRHATDEEDSIHKEYEACHRLHLDVELKHQVPGMKMGNQQCLEFRNQAQFHPLKYLEGLCRAVISGNNKIFTETRATEIDSTGVVTDKGYKITADHVVIASNSPVNNKYVIHLKQYAYRTYCIGARIPKNFPEALWWDTGDQNKNSEIAPYHYIRTQNLDQENNLLICGGEDHPTGLTSGDSLPEEERYRVLETWCRAHFPIEEVIYKWSGQVMEPMDGLAFIGKNPFDKSNVYIVTGDSGNGLTHGTIAGMLIPDLIMDKENPWEKLYDPSRFKIFKAGKVFFKEVIGGFIAYLKESPKDTDEVQLSSINKGEGKIIEIGGKKHGVYADEQNTLHMVSAECTHLKCIINWNNDEKTWDCPCHGSRFSQQGKVLNGPALKDLEYRTL